MNPIKPIKHITPFLIKTVLLTLIHEMGHLLTLLLLGLRAELGCDWYGFFIYNTDASKTQLVLVALGGILCIPFGFYFTGETQHQNKCEWSTVTWIMLLYSVMEVMYFIIVPGQLR